MIRRLATTALPLMALAGTAGPQTPAATSSTGNKPPPAADSTVELGEVEVTAPRLDLLGTAMTASQGVIDNEEIQLTPVYRSGQILETIPGLTVTAHSGEGKANQYLLRGYNLDHGTDLETWVDAMPINQPTHARSFNPSPITMHSWTSSRSG
jgi:outer membrane cobalamin receptor